METISLLKADSCQVTIVPKQAECTQQPSGQRRTAVHGVQNCRGDSEVQEVCMKA